MNGKIYDSEIYDSMLILKNFGVASKNEVEQHIKKTLKDAITRCDSSIKSFEKRKDKLIECLWLYQKH